VNFPLVRFKDDLRFALGHEAPGGVVSKFKAVDEPTRRRLVHPLSNVRRWRTATHANGKCADDPVKAATVAWSRFRSCLDALPVDEAGRLWQSVAAEATTHVAPGEIFLQASGGVGAKEGDLRSPWCFGSSV
jgi:hypothetical protein